MAKVLIINPNTDTFGRHSIPTALISALLKKNGHEVELFDTTFMATDYLYKKEKTHEKLNVELNFFEKVDFSGYNLEKKKVDVIHALEEKIGLFKPDFIAFSFWGSQRHAVGEFHAFFHGLKIIEQADTKNIPIVVGGTVPTWNTKEVLQHPKINYVVRGEGELAFLEMADRIDRKESLSGIANLSIKKSNGEIEENNLRPLIASLDELPHADFDIYDDRTFYRPFHGEMRRCIDYELSRGCIYQCTFCLSPFQQETYHSPKHFRREKSVNKIIEEIRFLKDRYKLDLIRYHDETFLTMKAEKLEELAPRYRDEVNLPFVVEATLSSVNERKIKALKMMGCLSLSLGLESGNQYIRDNVLKKPKFTNEEAIQKVKLIKKSGMSLNLFNIIGFPEETEEMILETIEVNYKAKPPYCMVGYFQPWEGTKLRDYAIQQHLLDERSQGLDNSQDNLQRSSLSNLKISSEKLEHYHRNFAYYVYINKLFWPLIRYSDKKSFLSAQIRKMLSFVINMRFKFAR